MEGMKRFVLVAVLAAVGLGALAITVSAVSQYDHILIGGLLNTAWLGHTNPDGYPTFTVDVTVEVDPGVESSYFYALQSGFTNHINGAYMGLQTNGYDGTNWIGNMAIFSVWDVSTGTPEPEGTGVAFGGEGNGYSVRIPFDWQEGTKYRFSIEMDSLETTDPRVWSAHVTDMTTGWKTRIGRVSVPASYGLLDAPVTFVERFAGEANSCDDVEPNRVRIERFRAVDGNPGYGARYFNHFVETGGLPACPNLNWHVDSDEGFVVGNGIAPSFSDGAMLKERGFSAVYLIKDGKRHLIPNDATYEPVGGSTNIFEVEHSYLTAFPEGPELLREGSLIRARGTFDVFIVKYSGTKQFKRLILNPTVFESYEHLHWEDVVEVEQNVVDAFSTASLVRYGDEVFFLTPNGDQGVRQSISDYSIASLGLDADSIYQIIGADRDSYTLGDPIVSGPEETVARVTFVVDGDTIDLDNGERVRLIGIDTPETGETFYTDARNALITLVLNKEIRLLRDVNNTDVYGRLVRYIYIGTVFINFEMVRFGYAEAFPFYPDTRYADILDAAETLARIEGRGMWGESAPIPVPPEGGYIVPACVSTDCNCGDFDTQAHAQWFMENYDPYNSHRLDGAPVDGFVCESLP